MLDFLHIYKIEWNFNNIKDKSMLLGYKVEVEYLNHFVNYLTKSFKFNRFQEAYFKKELLLYKLFKNVSLYEIFIFCISD